MALAKSISHLNKGWSWSPRCPTPAERMPASWSCASPLGTAWMALKGWAAPEVWASFHPALALAKSLGRNDALLPILWGLWSNVHCRGRIAESLDWAKEMLDAARGHRRFGSA